MTTSTRVVTFTCLFEPLAAFAVVRGQSSLYAILTAIESLAVVLVPKCSFKFTADLFRAFITVSFKAMSAFAITWWAGSVTGWTRIQNPETSLVQAIAAIIGFTQITFRAVGDFYACIATGGSNALLAVDTKHTTSTSVYPATGFAIVRRKGCRQAR